MDIDVMQRKINHLEGVVREQQARLDDHEVRISDLNVRLSKMGMPVDPDADVPPPPAPPPPPPPPEEVQPIDPVVIEAPEA